MRAMRGGATPEIGPEIGGVEMGCCRPTLPYL